MSRLSSVKQGETLHGRYYMLGTLALLLFGFLIWGIMATLIDLLVPALRWRFDLDYAEAMRVQLAFFSAYILISIPSAYIANRWGYAHALGIGFLGMSVGGFVLASAASSETVITYFYGVFFLAVGVVFIQVSASPYVFELGAPERASQRVTLAHGIRAFGVVITPIAAAQFAFMQRGGVEAEGQDFSGLATSLMAISFILLTIACFVAMLNGNKARSDHGDDFIDHLRLAVVSSRSKYAMLAVFAYVGAEVAIGSTLVLYAMEPEIAGLSSALATRILALYWLALFAGRICGVFVLKHVSERNLLVAASVASGVVAFTALVADGWISLGCLLMLGLCYSVQMPIILSMSFKSVPSEARAAVSGLVCMGIVGGGLVPLFMGMVADQIGLQSAILVPFVCSLYIVVFALGSARKVSPAHNGSKGPVDCLSTNSNGSIRDRSPG